MTAPRAGSARAGTTIWLTCALAAGAFAALLDRLLEWARGRAP